MANHYRSVIRQEEPRTNLAVFDILDPDEDTILTVEPYLFHGTDMTAETVESVRRNNIAISDPEMDEGLAIPLAAIPAVVNALNAYYRRTINGAIGREIISFQGDTRHSYCGASSVPEKSSEWFAYLYTRNGPGWTAVLNVNGYKEACHALAKSWVEGGDLGKVEVVGLP